MEPGEGLCRRVWGLCRLGLGTSGLQSGTRQSRASSALRCLCVGRQRCAVLGRHVFLGAGWQCYDKRVSALCCVGSEGWGEGLSPWKKFAGGGSHLFTMLLEVHPSEKLLCSVLVLCQGDLVVLLTPHSCLAVSLWTSNLGAWWLWWALWARESLPWCQPCWGRWRISRDTSISR